MKTKKIKVREIVIKLTFDPLEWEDYDDVCDELMLEDGLSLKEGIEYEILPPVKKLKK